MRPARRLAHGWILAHAPETSPTLIADFIRPAIRAIPAAMANRLGPCRITFTPQHADPTLASRWTETDTAIEFSLVTTGAEEYDIALELLVCIGEALWERLSPEDRAAYWRIIDDEIRAGVPGEIDEDALAAKHLLLSDAVHARSLHSLEQYGRTSFAATAAEYVHSMWHDVSLRTGPDHLSATNIERRFRLFARWFPPNSGYPLFAFRSSEKRTARDTSAASASRSPRRR